VKVCGQAPSSPAGIARAAGLRAWVDCLVILWQTASQVEDFAMTHSWFCWLRCGCAGKAAPRTHRASKPQRFSVPQLIQLEDRTVLSMLTVLNNADIGAGSLRDTIASAHSGDTVVFDPSLMHDAITLTSGAIAIGGDLTIYGFGADLLAISGNQHSRIFELSSTAQVTVANLTLTGGLSSQGGAILIGGGASLTLNSDILSGNQAVGDANNNALGGAIFNSAGASLTINNTSFLNNQTNGTNESFGGALVNAGTLAIHGATFTDNAALGSTKSIFGSTPAPGGSLGGAIGNLDGATAAITLSTFTGNEALGSATGDALGGAICNEDVHVFPFTGSGVTSTVSQCTFTNNTAKGGNDAATDGGRGGAIGNQPGTNSAILNCSFTGNQANSGGGGFAQGGAIDDSLGVTGIISDCHLISNSAVGSGAGATADGGAFFNVGTATITNSSFTGNNAAGGPMADGTNTAGQALGGAICSGFGLADHVSVILTLSNSIVAANEAMGGSGGSTLASQVTGFTLGGGIANVQGGTLNVAGCTITGNQAVAGASSSGNGGVALGGGIANRNQSRLNLTNSTVSANLCQGGAGASAAAGGGAAGGGIVNDLSSIAILTNSNLSLNECLGGTGGAGANGGAALGGGIANAPRPFLFGLPDASSLIVSNCQLVGNVAQGGTAGSSAVAGDALGGGLFAGSGTVMLEAALVSGNQSQGGADSQGTTSGNGLGGGVYVDPGATASANAQTIMAGNHASKDNNDVFGTINIVP
jgi:hypothetical protein